jgi:hypothetical protein
LFWYSAPSCPNFFAASSRVNIFLSCQLSLIQADFGVCEQARQNVATIPTGKTRDAAGFAGFVFATCGEAAKAETVALELGKNYPLNTVVQNR